VRFEKQLWFWLSVLTLAVACKASVRGEALATSGETP